jgi:quinol monooxygenase YgiN
MIHVLATIYLQPGTRGMFLAELMQVVPHVRAEQGCHEYTPTVDVATNLPTQHATRDDVVVIVERWENMEALERHLVAPHMIAYRPKVREYIARVDLQILEPARIS